LQKLPHFNLATNRLGYQTGSLFYFGIVNNPNFSTLML